MGNRLPFLLIKLVYLWFVKSDKLFAAFLIGTLFLFYGCSKKEERRITGNWLLKSYTATSSSSIGMFYNHDSYSFGGSTMTHTFSGKMYPDSNHSSPWDTTYADVYSYSLSLDVKKNGSYCTKEDKGGIVKATSDAWKWNGDYSHVIFNSLGSFNIGVLTNREMTLSQQSHSSGGGGSGSWSSSYTFKK